MRPFDFISALTEQYESSFRQQLGPIRRIGREAEFPVVGPDGRAADIGLLWEPLLSDGVLQPIYEESNSGRTLVGAQFADGIYQVEVGRGTIELSLGPYDDLWQLEAGLGRSLARLLKEADSRGLRVLGFGIQPRTLPSPTQLTQRPRYHAFSEIVRKPWLRLTTTAADQMHVDIVRAEVLDAFNWMNLLSGPVIALCANSSVYGGQYLCGREAFLRDLGERRDGITPRMFGTLEEVLRYLSSFDCYLLPDREGYRRVEQPFIQFAEGKLGSQREGLREIYGRPSFGTNITFGAQLVCVWRILPWR